MLLSLSVCVGAFLTAFVDAGTIAGGKSTTASGNSTYRHPSLSSHASSNTSTSLVSSSAGTTRGIGEYIRSGLGLGSKADANGTSTTPTHASSSGYPPSVSSGALSSSSRTTRAFIIEGSAGTGLSRYSHGQGLGTGSLASNLSVASATGNSSQAEHSTSTTARSVPSQGFAYHKGSFATGRPANFSELGLAHGVQNSSTYHPTAFSRPSDGFLAGSPANVSGIYAATNLATGTGPITSTSSSPWTVPASGNGSSYAWACNAEWESYYELTNDAAAGTAVNTTSWATDYTATVTTFCDGHPRVLGAITPIASQLITTVEYVNTSYTGPVPTCSVGQNDCSSMQRAYAVAANVYQSALQSYISGGDVGAAPQYTGPAQPVCTVTGAAATASYCGACTVMGGQVQLLYFPVTTNASIDWCATQPATSTVCPFGPTTANASQTNSVGQATAPCAYLPFNTTSTADSGPYIVSAGTTFYENRAYISYATAYATNNCGLVGAARAGGLITMASSDVYSVSGYHYEYDNYAYSFNFADLSGHVPWSAYDGMPECAEGINTYGTVWPGYPDKLNGALVGGQCAVVFDGAYAPVLAVPPQFYGLDKEWEGCGLGLEGLWDPPKALQPASSEAAPTSPSQPNSIPTTSASPAQSATPPVATTAAPSSSLTPAPSDTKGSSTAKQSSNGGGNATPTSQGGGDGSVGHSSAGNSQETSAAQSSTHVSDGSSGTGGRGSGSGGSSIGGSGGETGNPGSGGSNGSGSSDPGSDGSGSGSNTASDVSDPGSGTSVVTAGSSAYTVVGTTNVGGSSAVVVAGGGSTATLAPGQSTNLGSQVVSAPSSGGVVIGSGSSAATVTPQDSGSGDSNGSGSSGGSTVVSVGSSAFTILPTQVEGSSAIVVAHGGSTATLTPGESTTLAGQALSAPSSGGSVIGSGSNAATVDPGSAASSQPNVGGAIASAAQAVAQGSSPTSAGNVLGNLDTTLVVSGHTLTAVADPSDPSVVLVDGSSVTLGGSGASIDGVSVSLATSGLVADGTVIVSATPIILGTVIANGKVVTVEQSPGGGQTLLVEGTFTATLGAGGIATLAGQTLSLGSSGESSFAVVDGTTTIPLSLAAATYDPQAIVNIGGNILTATELGRSGSSIAIDGTTLSEGGPAATIDGAVVSLGSSGVVIGGTQTLPFSAFTTDAPSLEQAVVTLDGHVLTATEFGGSASGIVIDGTTLSPGQAAVTIDGEIVSAGASGLVLDGTKTVPFTSFTAPTAGYGSEAVIPLRGHTLTAIESPNESYVLIDGTTLYPGGIAETISGTIISNGANGIMVGGTKTVSLTAIPTMSASEAMITIGSQVYTAIEPSGASFVIIDGTTLYPGGPAVTIDGTAVSDGLDGLVIGGTKTIKLSGIPTITPARSKNTGSSNLRPAAATSTSGTSILSTPFGLLVWVIGLLGYYFAS